MFQLIRQIKYFIQRGRRGWSEEDTWSFDDYLCNVILGGLKHLRNVKSGCPSELYDEKAKNNEFHKWNEVLEEMIQGFEAAKVIIDKGGFLRKMEQNRCYTDKVDLEFGKQLTRKFKRGMELFTKYFFSLWD